MREERPTPILNVAERLASWRKEPTDRNLSAFAALLGVTNASLEMLECTRTPYYKTWAFPMRTGANGLTGIRLRNEKGEKWAERGSHQGLFIPQTKPQGTVLIVEGPTDTAAALTMGYFALGRPSCCGGIEDLKLAVLKLKIKRVVIVADLDDPGLRGAKTLAEHLPVPSAIMVCPVKDLRKFLNQGGNREMMEAIINTLLWKTAG
jgi:5S rRNA maturation endonuclease (ribonuclease M5)